MIYHLLPEGEPFSDIDGGELSRWVANAVRGTGHAGEFRYRVGVGAAVVFYVAAANLWAGNLLTPSTLECVPPFIAYAGLRSASRRIRGLQAA
jgi:hypothetical protein